MIGCRCDDVSLLLQSLLLSSDDLVNHEIPQIVPNTVSPNHNILFSLYLIGLVLVIDPMLWIGPISSHLDREIK